MALAADIILSESIRTLAGALLFRALRLSRRLDHRFPWLGAWVRRLILILGWDIAQRLGARLRETEQADMRRHRPPDVAPELIVLPRSATPLVSVIIPTFGQ